MRIFDDFEFNEDGRTIEPISYGAVKEDGTELYIEFAFDEQRVRDTNLWVTDNVLPLLSWPQEKRMDLQEVRIQIYNFIGDDPAPMFWGYFADYDHVARCQLWGRMVDLPDHFPMWTNDTKQLFWHLGSPEGLKPPKPMGQHNSLVDARWIRRFFVAMKGLAEEKGLVV